MIPSKRKRFVVEALEQRTLLAAQTPVAKDDVYYTNENENLNVPADETLLRVSATTWHQSAEDYQWTFLGDHTWTTRDGRFFGGEQYPTWGTSAVSIDYDSNQSGYWILDFASPDGQALVPGVYTDAQRDPFEDPGHPGLGSITDFLDPPSSYVLHARFTVRQCIFDSQGNLLRFAADFVQNDQVTGTVEYHYGGGVLLNDLSSTGSPLSAALVGLPSHGKINFSSDGLFTYTPDSNFAGTDSFTYVAIDGLFRSAPSTVTINVLPSPDPPSFTKGTDVEVPENGGSLTIKNWAKNISPGAVAASASFVVVPESIGLFWLPPTIDAATGDLTIMPHGDAFGTTQATVILENSDGAAFSQSFQITIGPVVTGVVENVYAGPGGTSITTPLADRVVYDDLNGNGRLDPGEFSTTTYLDGSYSLTVDEGQSTIRVQELPGWAPTTGYADDATVSISPTSPRQSDVTLYTSMKSPVVIDVAAFYTNELGDDESDIKNYFEQANQAYANSDTNILLNLVGIAAANYSETPYLGEDLDHFGKPTDQTMSDVEQQRDAWNADVGVLFRESVEQTQDSNGIFETFGIAYELNPAKPDASQAWAVVAVGAESQYPYTLAHEIGHILGAGHDSANNSNPTTAYAHGWNNGTYRDMMAYGDDTVLPFFSTPRFSYGGAVLGDASSEDNARVVRENAHTVASYRGAVWPNNDPNPPWASSDGGDFGDSANQQSSPVSSSFKGPKSAVKTGASASLKLSFKNVLTTTYTGNLSISYYLSTDQTIDAFDTLIKQATVKVKKLKAGKSSSTSMSFKIDKHLATGTYYVLASINGQTPQVVAITVKAAKTKKH